MAKLERNKISKKAQAEWDQPIGDGASELSAITFNSA